MPERLRRGDLLLTAALLGLFAFMLGEAARYPRDSRLFPTIIGVVGLVAAALLLLRILMGAVSPPPRDEEEGGPGAAPLWAALLGAPVFGLLMWVAGFWVATAFVAFFGPATMGYRDIRRRLALALGTLGVLYVLFPLVLNLPLPRGEIMERLFATPIEEEY